MRSDGCWSRVDEVTCSDTNDFAFFVDDLHDLLVLGTLVNAVAYVALLSMNLSRRSSFWAWAWPLIHLAIVGALLATPAP